MLVKNINLDGLLYKQITIEMYLILIMIIEECLPKIKFKILDIIKLTAKIYLTKLCQHILITMIKLY